MALPVVGLVLVLIAGSVVYARANKAITLDVDGTVTTASTFSSSVADVLDERGITVGEHDLVTPSSGSISDGTQIVVRHGRQIDVQIDGVQRTVWTTALSADEAISTLEARGQRVQLVASRSNGRADLNNLAVSDGKLVDVRVDGLIHTVNGGGSTVDGLLRQLDVTLAPLDTVSVDRSSIGRVTVRVARVVVTDVTTVVAVPFTETQTSDASRFTGTSVVTTAGVPGERTVVETVTTVDGVETSRVPVSDTVTKEPVAQVVAVGTKARPVAPAAAAAPAAASTDSLNWAALAACESGGNPAAVSRSGAYHGLYQFSVSTWASVGGTGLPSQASADEQTARAKALYERSGAGQWPHCGPRLFG